MTWPRRRQALFFAGLLLFLAFFSLVVAAIWSVPPEVRLLPGEVGRLRVGFPLSLFAPQGDRTFLADSVFRGAELAFRSASTGVFQVELKLLGVVAVRRVAVRVLPERKVVPGGQAIGVLLAVDGVIVVGHRPLRGLDGTQYYPARDAGIEVGDLILRVDDVTVHHAEDLVRLVGRAAALRRRLSVTFRRAGRLQTCLMNPVTCRWPEEDGSQRTRAMLGLYVEDPAAGVGTLSFYDPATNGFAALGHRITELGGQRRIGLEGGKIVAACISGIEQGQRGNPGEKIGTFSGPEDILGTIERNTRFGLFGKLDGPLASHPDMPVALAHQVHPGSATILTVVQGSEIQEFTVEIVRVYPQSRPRDKGLVLKVTDPQLLSMTGGIVQGMSGSPIIQDGLLVGAVTHVFVNDPTRGYGVLAEWMIEEMEAEEPTAA